MQGHESQREALLWNAVVETLDTKIHFKHQAIGYDSLVPAALVHCFRMK
jgi:hypothetical protein